MCSPLPRLLGAVSRLFYINHFRWFVMMSAGVSLVRVHLFLLSICVLLPQIVRDSLQIILYKAFSVVRGGVVGSFIGSSWSVSVVHLCASPPDCWGLSPNYSVSKLFCVGRCHWFVAVSSGVSLVRVHLFLFSNCVLLPRIVGGCLRTIPYKAFSWVHNGVVKNFIGSGSSVSVVHLCTGPPDC